MTLWTIQHREAYNRMVQTGILRANEDHLFCGDDFRAAYDWMGAQMRTRIGPPPAGVRYPVWLWHTWEGERKRPDMRSRRYGAPGTPIVLLTVKAPDSAVLLSDFDRWHGVLTRDYIAKDEADADRPHTREETAASWNGIFDVSDFNPRYSSSLSVQATVWQIPVAWIGKVEFFTAR